MNTFKKARIVIVPTNEKSVKRDDYSSKIYHMVDGDIANGQNGCYLFRSHGLYHPRGWNYIVHLYVTSDETPKDGDWCINSYDNQIWQYRPSPCPLPYWGNLETLTKIIATTNTSLGLPNLSESAIEYCIQEYDEHGSIGDVLVEYDELEVSELKINELDNTINIKIPKNTWTRDEVIDILNSWSAVMLHIVQHESYCIGDLEDWINENLH